MKLRTLATLVAMLVVASARGAVYNYDSGTIGHMIDDDSASPYLNSISVSGVYDSQITDVNVYLSVSGGWNGDLYAYLTHNNATTVILLNRIGVNGAGQDGFSDAGLNIWLDDGAGDDIHLYGTGGSPLADYWQPDGRAVDPDDVVNASDRTAMLNLYNNQNPNGTWTLAFADLSGGNQSTLNSWSLQIEAVPEPTDWALIIFALLGGVGKLAHWHQARKLRPL